MSQTIINIRMDEILKRNFDYICDELGMNMSTAITIFAKKVCRERRIPFDISLPDEKKNERSLTNSMTQFKITVFAELDDKMCKTEVCSSLEEAIRQIREKSDELWQELISSPQEEHQKSIPYWIIELINPRSLHSQSVLYFENGLEYIHDNIREEINCPFADEETDNSPEFVAYGFIKALLSADTL